MAHHSFNVEVATECGVACALILGHIDFLVEMAKANGVNKFRGKHWISKSMKSIAEAYPYYTEKQIRRAIGILREKKLIETGHFPTKETPSTLWYTVTKNGKKLLSSGAEAAPTVANQSDPQGETICPTGQNESPTVANQSDPQGESSTQYFSTYFNTVLEKKEREKDAPGVDAGWMEFVREYGSNIGLLPTSTVERGDLEMFFTEFGVDVLREIIHYTARKHPDNPHVYFAKLCRNWLGKGIKTAEQAKAAFKDYERKRDNRRRQDATSGEYAAPEDVFG